MGELASERVAATTVGDVESAVTTGEPALARASRAALVLPPLVAVVALVLAYSTVDIVSPAIPALKESLALSATGAGLVWSVFFGGRLLTNLPAALLIGRIGPRGTAAAGAASLLVGSLLAATAAGEGTLLAARGLQGGGIALLVNAGLLSLLRAWPGRGAAMTAFNVAAGIGTSIGLLSGGLLTANLGWRGVFWLSSGVSAALLAGALLARTDRAHAPARPPATAGDEGATRVSRPALAGALAGNLMVYANYSVWVLLLPLYVAERFDLTPEAISWVQMALNGVHLVAAFPVGRAIGLYGSREVLAVGLAVTALGLAVVPVAPTPLWLLLPLALYAVGQMGGNSGAGDLVLRLGGRGGRAVGMVRLTSDLGLVIGPYLVGRLVDLAGVNAPFGVLAALSGLGAVAVWLSRLNHAGRRGAS